MVAKMASKNPPEIVYDYVYDSALKRPAHDYSRQRDQHNEAEGLWLRRHNHS